MTTFSGEHGVAVFRATALASGLRLYAKTGMKPNRMWTPRAMMQAAEAITGQRFKARAYLEAADALKAYADEQARLAHAAGQISP